MNHAFEFWFVFILTVVTTPFLVLAFMHPCFEPETDQYGDPYPNQTNLFWPAYIVFAVLTAILLGLVEYAAPGGLLG